MKKLFLLLAISLALQVGAQNYSSSDAILKSFKAKCTSFISALEYSLEVLSSKEYNAEKKSEYLYLTPVFFVADGKKWKGPDGINHNPVFVHINTIKYGNVTSNTNMVSDVYLKNINSLSDENIKLRKCQICLYTGVQRIGENASIATLSYYIWNCDDNTIYEDTSKSDCEIIVDDEEAPEGKTWMVSLGDIWVEHIKR